MGEDSAEGRKERSEMCSPGAERRTREEREQRSWDSEPRGSWSVEVKGRKGEEEELGVLRREREESL